MVVFTGGRRHLAIALLMSGRPLAPFASPECLVRWASTSKSKAAVRQKQQFRKRQKDALARASATSPSSNSHRDALISALFSRDGETAKGAGTMEVEEHDASASMVPTSKTLDDRAVIGKAWSRLRMLQLHAQSTWERAFLQSRIEAMAKLQQVSPELARLACAIDYSIPPLHRRIPTDTPPEPSKFPFVMEKQK